MKAVNLDNRAPVQRWRLYRLSVIARLDDAHDVRLAMRCATSDCGQYPVNERQLPLGLPPIKCMLSFEIRMPQMRAGQLLVALERALLSVPIVLLRLEVMGGVAGHRRGCPGRIEGVPSRAQARDGLPAGCD